MFARVCLVTAVIVAAGACAETHDHTAPSDPIAPQFGAGAPDLDGLPDLTVDGKRLARSWVLRDEEASQCAIDEADVSPGPHRVLRFTATTPNIGDADVFVGDPLEHIAANDGMFEFATCHDHYHFRSYATYELISVTTGTVVQAAKRGFCMVDVSPAGGGDGAGHGPRLYDRCGTRSTSGFQGISVGWADTYSRWLDGQYFVLDEPGALVPPGDYILRITVNPPFVCGDADGARPRDAAGLCHMFAERDYGNNVAETQLTLSADAKSGSGPGGAEGLTAEELVSIRTKTNH